MPTPHARAGTSTRQLVSPRERSFYALILVISLAVYGGLALAAAQNPQAAATIVAYGLVFSLMGLLAHGLALGRIRGNAIRVSERQFPVVQRLAVAHSRKLGLKQVPAIYVVQAGGLLNAFATRFLGRDFVILYSDILELALAGKRLHGLVDLREYAAQAVSDHGFWIRRAELASSHPLLPKRVAALLNAGIVIPPREQWAVSSQR